MNKTTFKVSYFIRRDKPFANGEVPINIRITLNGERVEFNAKRSVDPNLWNQKTCRAVGKSEKTKSLNSYLNLVNIKLCDSMRDLEERGIEVTAENIKNNYLGLMEHKQLTLFTLYTEHNNKMKALLNKGYALSTLEKHYTTVTHLKEFLKKKYKMNDIAIDKIDNIFLTDFQFFLRSDKSIGNNTTIKYMKNIGKILKTAYDAGYIKRNPMTGIRMHTEEIERPFLDKVELETLYQKTFTVKRLEQIKDAFLFCCFTGLSFIDAKTLTPESLYTTSKEKVWIKKQRQKTKKWSHIPLLPQAKAILDKYENHSIRGQGYLLPFPTNQKMNAYLKEIAELCGINKNLSTHCARHTFSTTVTLANGISMESVSKMLGHSSILMTKTYARILDSSIEKEMDDLAKFLDFD